MVKYLDWYGCKQFISGKLISFGYTILYVNSKDKYLVNFDMYQEIENFNFLFGKTVLSLIHRLKALNLLDSKKNYHILFIWINYLLA